MASKLQSAGLIERRPSPTDGRATIVELSEQGRAMIPDLQARWQALADSTIAGFTAMPPDQLIDALAELARSMHGSADDSSPAQARARARVLNKEFR
jgi:DNA-binding MarR family transcriptional regulator